FVQSLEVEYEKVRAQHGEQKAKPLLSLEEARRRQTQIEWKSGDIARPDFIGVRVLSSEKKSGRTLRTQPITISELVPFIDWSPFFHTWEMRGRYPSILENPEAKKLFQDAQDLLAQIVEKDQLTLRAVHGFFPANAVGDDVELYTDESRSKVLTRFHFLR